MKQEVYSVLFTTYDSFKVFAPGQAIESSLKQLAERRTDIFGVGEEAAQEAAIGMKMGEEDRRVVDDKIQWDGQTSSAEATARAARANITLNDQVILVCTFCPFLRIVSIQLTLIVKIGIWTQHRNAL